MKEFIDLLRSSFYEKLRANPGDGWSKDEIFYIFEKSILETVATLDDDQEEVIGRPDADTPVVIKNERAQ